MKFKSPIYNHISWRVFLDFFSRGFFFLINILIARVLPVEEYGKFGYAISMAMVFYIFTDPGIHLQLIKELGEARGKSPSAWLPFYEIKLIIMAVVFVVFAMVSRYLWHWEHSWLLILALLWMFSNSLLDFNQFICNGLGRLDLAGGMMGLQRVTAIIGVLIPIIWHRTLIGVLVGYSLGGVIGAIISNVYFFAKTGITPAFRTDKSEWLRILKVSYPNGISGAFGAWYLRIAPILIAWECSSLVLGEYSGAFRLFEATYIIPAAIMSVSVPHLSESLQKGLDSFLHELKRIGIVILPVGALWVLFLYFGAGTMVPLLLGGKYAPSIEIVRALALVSGMVFLNYYVTHLMIIFNAQNRHALHQFLVFVTSVLLHVYFIDTQGGVGAAKALLLTEMTLFFLTTTYIVRRVRHLGAVPA